MMPRTTAAAILAAVTSGLGGARASAVACACTSARRTPAAATASVGAPSATGRGAWRPRLSRRSYMIERAGDAEIDREAGRDLDHVVAERLQIARQAFALGPQDVGRLARMAEARQLDRLVGDLDADQPAAQRQAEGFEVGEMVGRHRARRVRGVAVRSLAAVVLGPHREHEGGAEGMGGAEQGADIHRLADAFDADAEIAFHGPAICCTNPRRCSPARRETRPE